MDVLRVCPNLICQDRLGLSWEGFLPVMGEDFQVSIQLKDRLSLGGARIDCEWKLERLLKPHKEVIIQRLRQCKDLAAFLMELKTIAEREMSNQRRLTKSAGGCLYNITSHRETLAAIDEIGWDRLEYVSKDLSEFHVLVQDEMLRNHILRIRPGNQIVTEVPLVMADTPAPFTFSWNQQPGKWRHLLDQFKSHLARFCDFWSMLDEIDSKVWILEPENPNRALAYRRIATGSSSSIHITIDPSHPRGLPECRFLGPEHAIGPMKENLNANLLNWSQERTILDNLAILLNIDFPSPATTKKEEFHLECGICYSYRLDDLIPDVSCEDARCSQPFHNGCLLEWLKSLPTSRQSFNIVFGECPYCSKPITVKMTSR